METAADSCDRAPRVEDDRPTWTPQRPTLGASKPLSPKRPKTRVLRPNRTTYTLDAPVRIPPGSSGTSSDLLWRLPV